MAGYCQRRDTGLRKPVHVRPLRYADRTRVERTPVSGHGGISWAAQAVEQSFMELLQAVPYVTSSASL